MQWMKQDGSDSLGAVLSHSFEALPIAKKKHFLAMAVLPKGVDAGLPMLLNLWDIEVSPKSGGQKYLRHNVPCAMCKPFLVCYVEHILCC